jgi:hypothetical protein
MEKAMIFKSFEWLEHRIQSKTDARVWLSIVLAQMRTPGKRTKNKGTKIKGASGVTQKGNINNENSKTTIHDDGGGRSRQ